MLKNKILNKIVRWISTNRKGLIVGFFIGSFITPTIAMLGLSISLFEMLRPMLIGPMDIIGLLIPNIQTGVNSYYVPVHKWIIVLGCNGIVYAIIGGLIQSIKKKHVKKKGRIRTLKSNKTLDS